MKKTLVNNLVLWSLLSLSAPSFGQLQVAMTIDDVPNTIIYKKDNFSPILLNKLDALKIPVTIFIVEGNIFKTDSVVKNFSLLNQWIKRDFVTPGTHTYAHSRYSEAGTDSFTRDIIKGEGITRELAGKYHKSLSYFRFPYNDLGADSLQHLEISNYLKSKDYTIAPFTIESSDYVFNLLYTHYIDLQQHDKAIAVANLYITTTLEYFDFFDSLSMSQYGRHIRQIFLCHDNVLNAEYIDTLVNKLKLKGYSFIGLPEALGDEVYKQPDLYNKKWGISWIYRWMHDQPDRAALMRREPDMDSVLEEYNLLKNLKK
ncbi:MAG: polysaccharide deacetylase family protein [Bacteroidetes bacterium]|nr:polysaccharide deacetylase family protein [Bacteroidota bacterium]